MATPAVAAENIGPQGPGSGGGGDFNQDQKPTITQVKEAISEARKIVPFVLNYYESVIVDARATGSKKIFAENKHAEFSIPLSVYQAMFPWPKPGPDIHERLEKTSWRIESDRPCFDGDNQSRAGSAYPFENSEICLSLPMIQKNATHANLLRRVIALMIHELAHKAGVHDEARALQLEEQILQGLPDQPLRILKDPIGSLVFDTRMQKDSFRQRIMSVQASISSQVESKPLDWDTICFELAVIATEGEKFGKQSQILKYSLSSLRPILQAEALAIQRRSQVLRAYCNQDLQPTALDQIFPANKESRAIGLGASGVLSIAQGDWRRPKYRDTERLSLELADIEKSLEAIHLGASIANAQLFGGPAESEKSLFITRPQTHHLPQGK